MANTTDPERYHHEAARLGEDFDDAIAHVRAEQDAGRISLAESAVERCELMERHLTALEQLRAEHLGCPG